MKKGGKRKRLSYAGSLGLSCIVAAGTLSLAAAAWADATKHIAVLPFQEQAAEAEHSWVGWAVAADLAHRLTRVPWLQVEGPLSAQAQLSAVQSPFGSQEEAAKLQEMRTGQGLDLILSGRYVVDDGRVSVAVRLITPESKPGDPDAANLTVPLDHLEEVVEPLLRLAIEAAGRRDMDSDMEFQVLTQPPIDEESYQPLGTALQDVFSRQAGLARDTLLSAVKERPGSPLLRYYLGLLLWSTAQQEEALTHLEAAATQDPFSISTVWGFYEKAAKAWEFSQVADRLEALAARHPTSGALWYTLGIAALEHQDAAGAAAAFRKLTETAPGFPLGHVYLGDALHAVGDNAGALHAYLAAINADTGLSEAYEKLLWCASTYGFQQEAVEKLAALVKQQPNDSVAEKFLGIALMFAGDYKSALEHLNAYQEKEPADVEGGMWYAEALAATGDAAGAVEKYAALATQDPRDQVTGRIYEGLKRALLAERGPEGAIQFYEKMVADAGVEQRPGAYAVLADLYWEHQGYSRAVEFLEETMTQDPSQAKPYDILADIADRQGGDDEAEAQLVRLATRHPGWDEPCARLGTIYESRKDLPKAAIWYSRATEANPFNSQAYLRLADVYLRQGRLEESGKAAQRATQLTSSDTQAWALLAEVYMRSGYYQKAIDIWSDLSQQYPDNAYFAAELKKARDLGKS